MAMDFYFKDLYPGMGGYVQTTEQTVPDGSDNAEIVEDTKAAAVADETKGSKTNGKKIIGVVLVCLCLAAVLGGRK